MFGFRPGRGTRQLGQLLGDLIADRRVRKGPLGIASFDPKKAYDLVPWWLMHGGMERLGVPKATIAVFRSYYARLCRSFRSGQRSCSELTARNGLPQGCPAAPGLVKMVVFVFHMWARRKNVGVALAGEVVSVISFSDDVAVMASSSEEFEVFMRGFLKFCRLAGFEVAIAKTQVWANRAAGTETVDVDGVAVSVSPTFKRVGITIGEDQDGQDAFRPKRPAVEGSGGPHHRVGCSDAPGVGAVEEVRATITNLTISLSRPQRRARQCLLAYS